jgi:diguanylate cyclase (GGDEF)-like protein
LGGDEFVALLTGSSHVETTAIMARLKDILDERNTMLQRGYDIRFSVGQIEYDPQRHDTVDRLLADADGAMYEHKQQLKRGHSGLIAGKPAPTDFAVAHKIQPLRGTLWALACQR